MIRSRRGAAWEEPSAQSDRSRAAQNLGARGAKLLEHARVTDDPGRLAEALDLLERARTLCPEDNPDRLAILVHLWSGLALRFGHMWRLDDLMESVAVGEEVVKATPAKGPEFPIRLSFLATALEIRSTMIGRVEDLKAAVETYRRAVEATSENDPERAGRLSMLGAALRLRFLRTGRVEDLEEAVVTGRRATEDVPEDHPDRPGILSTFGDSLRVRYERIGHEEDLEEALHQYRLAVGSVPPEDPDRPAILRGLVPLLRVRAERTSKVEGLDEAVELGREMVKATPEGHPNRPDILTELGDALSVRGKLTGLKDDHNKAVKLMRQAVGGVSQIHADKFRYIDHYGAALLARFEVTGRLEDLEEAVEVYRLAAKNIQPDDVYLPSILSSYGRALQLSFWRTGAAEDLQEAVDAFRRAVEVIPPDHLDYPRALSDLGDGLLDRFDRFGWVEDLDCAVDACRQAVNLTPEWDPDRPQRLSLLAAALAARSKRKNQSEDLDEAVTVVRKAVEATREGDPSRPGCLSDLGNVLRIRFVQTSQLKDLDEAVTVGRQAVETTPVHDPNRLLRLSNLGTSLWFRIQNASREEVGFSADLEEAIAAFRQASGGPTVPLPVRVGLAPAQVLVRSARLWARLSVEGEQWEEAVQAYCIAADLAGLLTKPPLGRADQEFRLGYLSGLGTEAAAACLQAGQPNRAVELFEQGRAVLFSQLLDARSDLGALPDLADRFVSCRDELFRQPTRRTGHFQRRDIGTALQEASRRRAVADGFDQVLAEIRKHKGFERFLLPRLIEELLPAAEGGPVVLLNISNLRSDALILTAHGVQVIPLDGVNAQEAADRLETFLGALARVSPTSGPMPPRPDPDEEVLADTLSWLGQRVTGPVLDQLGYTPKTENWPRVWWCPSGALSQLPLHAAGHHKIGNGPSDAVIDRVISSTIPTVGTLLQPRKGRRQPVEPRMLVVAMPHTPGEPDLPGAAAEAKALSVLFDGSVTVLGPDGTDDATFQTVKDALPRHPRVHFACHGVSSLADPSSSYLVLSDYIFRPLTVLDIMGMDLQWAELAFLAACTTRRTGTELLDEPIHIAAACQLAGYRHVVATMWHIGDQGTVFLTNSFYGRYKETCDHPHAVATALHRATREWRLLRREHPSSWAPYSHTGP